MNLNKVKRVRDGESTGMSEHGNVIVDALDYSQLRQSFPDNFYLVLASRVAPILTDKKKLKSDQTQTEFKIFGNDVKFSYPKLSISINGTKVPTSSTDGMKWFKDIIYNAIQMETNNSLFISRPEGRTLPKDRADFNKTDISMFKQLFKSTTVNEDHTKNLDVQGARGASKKRFLTQEQFDKYQPDGFTKYSNTSGDYYVKTGIDVIDITPENLNKAMHMLNMPNGNNRQAEYLARGPLGNLLTNHDETNPFTVVVSGQEAFLVEHNSFGDFKVQNINVSNNKVSEVMKNYKGAKEVDPVAIEYKNWLSENKLKPSEKNFNKFKDLPEFKHLFDSCTFTSRNYHQHILDRKAPKGPDNEGCWWIQHYTNPKEGWAVIPPDNVDALAHLGCDIIGPLGSDDVKEYLDKLDEDDQKLVKKLGDSMHVDPETGEWVPDPDSADGDFATTA